MIVALLLAAQVDAAPVTNGDYRKCVEATVCRKPAYDGKLYPESAATYAKKSGAAQPAVGVSWDDANAYCRWAGKKLASEADWLVAPSRAKGLYEWVSDVYAAGSKKRVLRDARHRTGELPNQRAHWITFRCAR